MKNILKFHDINNPIYLKMSLFTRFIEKYDKKDLRMYAHAISSVVYEFGEDVMETHMRDIGINSKMFPALVVASPVKTKFGYLIVTKDGSKYSFELKSEDSVGSIKEFNLMRRHYLNSEVDVKIKDAIDKGKSLIIFDGTNSFNINFKNVAEVDKGIYKFKDTGKLVYFYNDATKKIYMKMER